MDSKKIITSQAPDLTAEDAAAIGLFLLLQSHESAGPAGRIASVRLGAQPQPQFSFEENEED